MKTVINPAFSLYSYQKSFLKTIWNGIPHTRRNVHLHGHLLSKSDDLPPEPASLLVGGHLDHSVSKVPLLIRATEHKVTFCSLQRLLLSSIHHYSSMSGWPQKVMYYV